MVAWTGSPCIAIMSLSCKVSFEIMSSSPLYMSRWPTRAVTSITWLYRVAFGQGSRVTCAVYTPEISVKFSISLPG